MRLFSYTPRGETSRDARTITPDWPPPPKVSMKSSSPRCDLTIVPLARTTSTQRVMSAKERMRLWWTLVARSTARVELQPFLLKCPRHIVEERAASCGDVVALAVVGQLKVREFRPNEADVHGVVDEVARPAPAGSKHARFSRGRGCVREGLLDVGEAGGLDELGGLNLAIAGPVGDEQLRAAEPAP
eukprot:scaffold11204_cov32-Tisochrysis_lutea.AAC.1